MVLAFGLRHGTKPALYTVFGVAPGAATAMALSFLGLGAILAASSQLFTLVKLAGAVYLIYLGIMLWRSDPNLSEVSVKDQNVSCKRIVLQAFTVSLLNPKGIIFYMAFMPQFVSPDAPVLPQMLLLGFTFVLIVFPVNTAYALLSGKLRDVAKSRRVLRAMNRTGGTLLIGAGALTATLRRG
jgi:threonine/homoserine/homoserine lactone efflux protein